MSYAFTSKYSTSFYSLDMLNSLLILFKATLRQNPNQSYQELLNSVRDILRDKYSQRPQLSSSHPIDVDLPFVL